MSPSPILATLAAGLVAVLLLARPRVGIAALALFFPFNQFVPTTPLPGFNSETILFLLAIGVTLMRFGLRLPPLRVVAPLLTLLLVLLVGCAITASWYANTAPGLTNLYNLKWLKTVAFASTFLVLAYWWFPDDAGRRWLLEVLSVVVSIITAGALFDWLLGRPVAYAPGPANLRASGLIGDPNAVGGLLAAFSLVPLYLRGVAEIPAARRAVHTAIYASAVLALILTLSRSAWLAALVGHAVWLLYTNRTAFALGAATLVLGATIAYPLLPGLIRTRIEETFETGTTVLQAQGARGLESAAALRVVVFYAGSRMFLASPLWGHGQNSVYLLTPRYGARYGLLQHRSPHNLPLKFAAENGLIGLLALGWLVLAAIQAGLRARRIGGDAGQLGTLLLSAGAALAVSNLFTTMIFNGMVGIYFWTLLGITVRAETIARAEHEVPRPRRRAVSPLGPPRLPEAGTASL